MTPHVQVPRHLALDRRFRFVMDYLAQFDPELRVRKSVERRHMYVLERRIRNRPWANTGLRDLSDMHVQARDGYIHISTVHPQWLYRPWNIIRALKDSGADTWDEGGSGKIAEEIEYEETWARITRKRRRLQLFREIAIDAFDTLNRIGNPDGTERTRLSV